MSTLLHETQFAPEYFAQQWPEAIRAVSELSNLPSQSIEEIVICGCGDSHCAAQALELPLAEWTGRRVRSAPSLSASRYLIPRQRRNPDSVLVIGISASGEVARTLEAIEAANAYGCQTLALTCTQEGSLAQTARSALVMSLPELEHGPGLLSFLATSMAGLALGCAWSAPEKNSEVTREIEKIPQLMDAWMATEAQVAQDFLDQSPAGLSPIFLGSGPAHAAAQFGAAKVMEAAGVPARGQDVEEWSHLEYFCQPPGLPTWLLSSGGRSESREKEVVRAGKVIGRTLAVSRWAPPSVAKKLAELICPWVLWIGPTFYAAYLAKKLGEKAFRNFEGGRSSMEGGGASRIRSSVRNFPGLQEG
jgi:glutamine---fructose-6-phosphate transaminase (isomerizing)